MTSLILRVLLLVCLGLGQVVFAHESLPASLILTEQTTGQFEVAWRVPEVQGAALAVTPVMPSNCTQKSTAVHYQAPGAQLWKWTVRCEPHLSQAGNIAFEGLDLAGIDALVRVQWSNGDTTTRIAHRSEPSVHLEPKQQVPIATWEYLGLGVEHILGGTDHLLFVLCLMLLVPAPWALLKTITAFTIAHSVTLAFAALQWVNIPQPPIEALIALSILFLAREVALMRPSSPPQPLKKMRQRYWVVAFAFGLLHGFGFAGALADVGLPQSDIAPALLLFNLGVELGQILFILVIFPMIRLASRLGQYWSRPATMLPIYTVGSVAGFWFVQRMITVLGLAV